MLKIRLWVTSEVSFTVVTLYWSVTKPVPYRVNARSYASAGQELLQ